MPHFYTFLLHLVMALLSLGSIAYLFYWRKNFNLSSLREYFAWFLFFFLYNIALVLTVFLSPQISVLMAAGYRIALFLLALGTWQAFLAGLDFLEVSGKLRQALSWGYLAGVLLTVALHVSFFELPKAADEHWILWYSNQPVAFSYTAFMFLAGWTVALAIGRNMFALRGFAFRLRAGLIAFSAFLLPFAALFYFAANELFDLFISFWIVGISLVSFLLGNVGVGLGKKLRS